VIWAEGSLWKPSGVAGARPANPAWECQEKRCRLLSQAETVPPSSPPLRFSFQEPGVIVTNVTAPTSGLRGRSSPCKGKYRERQVVKHQPRQVLALKSLLTPVIYHSPSCYLQLGKDKQRGKKYGF